MDFFDHQERARRRTHLLVLYFALAVAGIVAAVYGLLLLFSRFDATPGQADGWWNAELFIGTAVITGGLIVLASTVKTLQLSGGGEVVARELGGRQIDPNTTDFHERRLLNVVEEMAIAAGVPVPAVYVMDGEESINAFAAGRTVSDAVVGVTRGCMTLLTRDELQGVVAHEFSHILNGDMRLNMRLMGLLFGILFLALIGEFMVRVAGRAALHSGRREGAGIGLGLVLLGAGLFAIGYIGSFFANLIKASISRQREFLADASAVQFTRNPEGIAGALAKIGGFRSGSRMAHPMARDASHMFFGSAFRSQLFATHPPLRERIGRVLPSWGGEFGEVGLQPITPGEDETAAAGAAAFAGGPGARPADRLPEQVRSARGEGLHLAESEAFESMRTLHFEQVGLGQDLLGALPEAWVEACHSRSGAQAMMFALLLAQDEGLRCRELEQLRRSVDPSTCDRAAALFEEVQDLHSAVKLALVDLSIPVLRQLSPAEYERFRELIHAIMASDQQIDLFEFSLMQVITRHLDTYFRRGRPPGIRHRSFASLRDETGVLLSTLAAVSHDGGENGVREAFRLAAAHLEEAAGVQIPFKPPDQCGLAEVEASLDRLSGATPAMKRQLLEACSRSVLSDGVLNSREAELVRAVADAMGCPIPPFMRVAALAEAASALKAG